MAVEMRHTLPVPILANAAITAASLCSGVFSGQTITALGETFMGAVPTGFAFAGDRAGACAGRGAAERGRGLPVGAANSLALPLDTEFLITPRMYPTVLPF